MKVFACPLENEVGKFCGVINAFPDIWEGRILDVGCRSKKFKDVVEAFNAEVCYLGLDLHPPADVIGNLEQGLPFSDKTFDVVLALDVLEHIDNIHRSFDELCRVSNKFVVITLPNSYELRARFKFLLGYTISGKYGLSPEPPMDRHRWLFSFNEALRFVNQRAQRCGFTVADQGCLIGPRRASLGGGLVVSRFPNLFSPWYLALLMRQGVVCP